MDKFLIIAALLVFGVFTFQVTGCKQQINTTQTGAAADPVAVEPVVVQPPANE